MPLGSSQLHWCLAWAVVFGFAMRTANTHTKDLLYTLAEVTSQIVRWIINLAPFSILGACL